MGGEEDQGGGGGGGGTSWFANATPPAHNTFRAFGHTWLPEVAGLDH